MTYNKTIKFNIKPFIKRDALGQSRFLLSKRQFKHSYPGILPITYTHKNIKKRGSERMRKMQIKGQITILEYLASIGAREIMSACLAKGQTVFFVAREKVMTYEVYGFYDVYDEESVVLVAKQPGIPLFRCIKTEDIGKTLFETARRAEEKALSNIEKDFIPVKDMRVRSFKAYVARTPVGTPPGFLTAFYAVLDNGYVYMKDYYSCGHLLSITEKEARDMLENQVRNYDFRAEETSKLPLLKDMYRVRDKKSVWEYAESDCPLTQEA